MVLCGWARGSLHAPKIGYIHTRARTSLHRSEDACAVSSDRVEDKAAVMAAAQTHKKSDGKNQTPAAH